jgi:DNA modification methylase
MPEAVKKEYAELRKEARELATLKPHPENPRKHPAPGSKEWKTLAASLAHDYFDPIVLNERNGLLVSGHLRTKVLLHLGYKTADVVLVDYDDDTHRARLVAANAQAGKDDRDKLDALFSSLRSASVDPVLAMLNALPAAPPVTVEEQEMTEENAAEVFRAKWQTAVGQVWQMGPHRLAVGECRDPHLLARLMSDERAVLIHADPPYGMGKEGDGVVNDNLYREKLDAFQMEWWRACLPFFAENGSAYIWGNAPDLWRLWYRGGLEPAASATGPDVLELRNEIVWDKGDTPGMSSDLMTQFPVATERALFLQRGPQFIGNVNSDQYYEGWDEIRLPLQDMAVAAGLTPSRCREITGVGMFAHWFSKSQWQFIGEAYYEKLAAAFPLAFTVPHAVLRDKYEAIKGGYSLHISGILGGMRSYFDNAHAIMRDVWRFPRVTGEERFGHATPKPVDMMKRVLLSSSPEGGVVLVPFGGTGPELVAAEQTGRKYRGVEIEPGYCAIILERWNRLTGKTPELVT